MQTKTYNVYKYDELTDEQKEKVLENLYDINIDHDWWELTYEDAKNIGLEITSFNLDRNRHAKGEFIKDAEYCQYMISQEHGEKTETYKTSREFVKDRAQLDINADDYEEKLEELEDDFLQSLLEDYSVILQNESEYLTSREAIEETIRANDYDFTEDGKID
jgi:myo-inositol catabolism protein IolC